MARSRNIKPGFFKNEILAELSCEIRLLFVGLWTIADREGRFEDRPKRIRAELFPFETFDVDAMLGQLQTAGFIRRYEADGMRYVEITNFVKHQDPHYKEKASVIPPPPGEENKMLATNVTRTQRRRILERDGYTCQQCGSTEHLCVDHILPVSRGGDSSDENLQVLCFSCNTKKSNKLDGEQSARKRDKHSEYRNFDPIKDEDRPNVGATLNQRNDASPSSSLIPDSLNRIPDSLTQGNGASAPPREYSEEFETAWNLYPPRAGSNPKKDAFKSWKARLKEGHTAEEMTQGAVRYRAYCEATKKFHTEYTMQASRFFGPSKPFTESWDIPRGTHETHQPTDNSAIGRVRRANAEHLGRTIDGKTGKVE